MDRPAHLPTSIRRRGHTNAASSPLRPHRARAGRTPRHTPSTSSSRPSPTDQGNRVLSPDNPTTDGLLAALRRHTNRPTLSWAVPPAPLADGFWAETFAVQLSDAPPELEGRLVARIMPDPAIAAFETAVHRHLTRCRFPAPSIRCADGPSSDLDRAWSLMDFATGRP